MLNVYSISPDPQLSVAIAIYFAKLALPVWKQKYPRDSRPGEAIEAAERALFAANAAANTAYGADAAYAADAAAGTVAFTAASAAYAAGDAVYAACAASAADVAAAHAAASYAAAAAVDAADALDKNEELFVHQHLTQLLPLFFGTSLIQSEALESQKKFLNYSPKIAGGLFV